MVPALAFEPDFIEYSKNAVSYDAVGKLYTTNEPEFVWVILAVVFNEGAEDVPFNITDVVTLNKRDSSPNHNILPSSVLKCGDALPATPFLSAEYSPKESAANVVGATPF